MDRREFSKSSLLVGIGTMAGLSVDAAAMQPYRSAKYYMEPEKKLPVRKFDVVIAGAGTGGVVAALAAAAVPRKPRRLRPCSGDPQ